MSQLICAKCYLLGNNIDTDQIYPGKYLELTEKDEIAAHVFEGVRPGFSKLIMTDEIIVAGTNFGCGSSREQAAIALKECGIGAIVAESFGRIFYRNAINLGMVLIVCPNVSKLVREGDVVCVNYETGVVINKTTEKELVSELLSPYAINILKHGGIKNIIREAVK